MIAIGMSLVMFTLCTDPAQQAGQYYTIRIVDEQTGRGVPLVELRTVNNVSYWTDSNGIVAFSEPGLMDQKVYFHIAGHGYEFPKDGFGFRGKSLAVSPGGSVTLKIKRLNMAQRLYRVTGQGIYVDSVRVGEDVPIREPLVNGLVFGSDSVASAIYHGKIYWFWGDTNRPSYPLGNFHVPGATSRLPSDGGLDPELGVDLNYFLDENGFAKETARMSGEGPTWITGLVTVGDENDRQRMVASYMKVRGQFEVYERGLVEFNDEQQQFDKLFEFPVDAPAFPSGHPFNHTDHGVEYIYFANPFPLVRVRATPEHVKNLASYESYSCLKPGTRLDDLQFDRGDDGALQYSWKTNTPPITPQDQAKLVKRGQLRPEDAILILHDRDSGAPVVAHAGSVYFNAYRQRWIMIATQIGGSSLLGEVWYAEAETPTGPWGYATKVVTHDKYSFYNPKQHPMFDKQDGRQIFFEGTYSEFVSGASQKTPRYDYNQIMYMLDLADQRLALPVAIYQLAEHDQTQRFGTYRDLRPGQEAKIAFYALDRELDGALPVYQSLDEKEHVSRLHVGERPAGLDDKISPLFFSLPSEKQGADCTTPLYQFEQSDGVGSVYSIDPEWSKPGYRRNGQPACIVWRNPRSLAVEPSPP